MEHLIIFFIILISIINPKPKAQIYDERIYEPDADGEILLKKRQQKNISRIFVMYLYSNWI